MLNGWNVTKTSFDHAWAGMEGSCLWAPSKSGLKLVCVMQTLYTEISSLRTLKNTSPEISTKLSVHELDFYTPLSIHEMASILPFPLSGLTRLQPWGFTTSEPELQLWWLTTSHHGHQVESECRYVMLRRPSFYYEPEAHILYLTVVSGFLISFVMGGAARAGWTSSFMHLLLQPPQYGPWHLPHAWAFVHKTTSFWVRNGTRLSARCHFTGPKKLSNSGPNPLPLALVMDMQCTYPKHYAGGCINHRCCYWYWLNPMRPKARELAQHGGPPGWLEESEPAGCDYVRNGRSMPPALIHHMPSHCGPHQG